MMEMAIQDRHHLVVVVWKRSIVPTMPLELLMEKLEKTQSVSRFFAKHHSPQKCDLSGLTKRRCRTYG